jgi:hypothetical protein
MLRELREIRGEGLGENLYASVTGIGTPPHKPSVYDFPAAVDHKDRRRETDPRLGLWMSSYLPRVMPNPLRSPDNKRVGRRLAPFLGTGSELYAATNNTIDPPSIRSTRRILLASTRS